MIENLNQQLKTERILIKELKEKLFEKEEEV